MSKKRKRQLETSLQHSSVVEKPAVGSRTFHSGKSVRDALATGDRPCAHLP